MARPSLLSLPMMPQRAVMGVQDVASFDVLGDRIMIIGPSCTGKSTLAHHIAERKDCPVLYLDQIAHYPDQKWVRRPDDVFVNLQNNFLATHNRWVIEGNYSLCMPERLKRATAVIWLRNDNRIAFLWNYMKRSFLDKKRLGGLEQNDDEFSFHLIHYTFTRARANYQKYSDMLDAHLDLPVVIIPTARDRKTLYKNLGI